MSGQSTARRRGAYDVRIYRSADAANAGREADGQVFPSGVLPHRLDWFEAVADGNWWWLAVRDLQHRPVAGFSVSVIPTRALPGHRFLRLERLRFAPDPGPAEAAVQYLVDLASRDRRTLGLTVETFFADEAERNTASTVLARAGFRRDHGARLYTHTVRVDLIPGPEEISANFHGAARRNIRAVTKHPVEIRLVQDVTLAARLDELLTESFHRTTASAAREPWRALIEYSGAHPDLARLVSLVRTDRAGPDALVAFALGLNHGDHVEYSTAGSARPPDLRVPLGYSLAWDLMLWGRKAGARWFDFGGIASDPSQDGTRKGIHDFKRKFGNDVVEVRQSWSFEARPVRAAWVRAVSRLAGRTRQLGRSESPSSHAGEQPG